MSDASECCKGALQSHPEKRERRACHQDSVNAARLNSNLTVLTLDLHLGDNSGRCNILKIHTLQPEAPGKNVLMDSENVKPDVLDADAQGPHSHASHVSSIIDRNIDCSARGHSLACGRSSQKPTQGCPLILFAKLLAPNKIYRHK